MKTEIEKLKDHTLKLEKDKDYIKEKHDFLEKKAPRSCSKNRSFVACFDLSSVELMVAMKL